MYDDAYNLSYFKTVFYFSFLIRVPLKRVSTRYFQLILQTVNMILKIEMMVMDDEKWPNNVNSVNSNSDQLLNFRRDKKGPEF